MQRQIYLPSTATYIAQGTHPSVKIPSTITDGLNTQKALNDTFNAYKSVSLLQSLSNGSRD